MAVGSIKLEWIDPMENQCVRITRNDVYHFSLSIEWKHQCGMNTLSILLKCCECRTLSVFNIIEYFSYFNYWLRLWAINVQQWICVAIAFWNLESWCYLSVQCAYLSIFQELYRLYHFVAFYLVALSIQLYIWSCYGIQLPDVYVTRYELVNLIIASNSYHFCTHIQYPFSRWAYVNKFRTISNNTAYYDLWCISSIATCSNAKNAKKMLEKTEEEDEECSVA